MRKIDIEKTLNIWQNSKASKIELAGLFARSDIAHKWKFTYRLIVVREGIAWRLIDILEQAYKIGRQEMIVGARILTRSALETLCLLIYMNRRMRLLVENKMGFEDFQELTRRFLLGDKIKKDMPFPVNVKTIIDESEKKYKGIQDFYNELCETAHPNHAGICEGYVKLNAKEHVTEFGVFWDERYGNQHEIIIELCIEIFENEYNKEWPKCFEALEKWLEKNDNKLERQRNKKIKKRS